MYFNYLAKSGAPLDALLPSAGVLLLSLVFTCAQTALISSNCWQMNNVLLENKEMSMETRLLSDSYNGPHTNGGTVNDERNAITLQI